MPGQSQGHAINVTSLAQNTPFFDGDQDLVAKLGKVSRPWVLLFEKIGQQQIDEFAAWFMGNGTGGGLPLRTIDVQDTTVGNDIADATIVHSTNGGPFTVQLVAGCLRKAITSDLVVRLNVYVAGSPSVVGTFTIPHTTAILTTVTFTSFTTPSLPDLSVLTWDITASDGSSDPGGIATFSIWYA